MSKVETIRNPSAFFFKIADILDNRDDWSEDQFKSVDKAIDKCESLANLCETRGYTSLKA